MAQRIIEDHQEFRGIIGGRLREELKKHIKTGSIFRQRGKNGKIAVTIPRIDLPHIVFGKPDSGVGRGPGDKGKVIDKDPDKGKKGQPGTDPGDGITVLVDLDEVLKLMKEELQLPDMKPKANQTFEDIRIIYNGISKIGPNSLLHKTRTMKQCMKRLAALGQLDKKVLLPGYTTPVPLLAPINDDKRYRQYNEIRIPTSNAVLFFMRDGSGSMDQYKTDIVSDICWWIELYIKKYYKKTECVHIWHDTEAKEVSAKHFYELRYGGGTYCTSAVKLMSKIVKNRYNPIKWNVYGFYFGDGESFGTDNQEFVKVLKNPLGPNVVNMFGQVEILHYAGFGESLKAYLDKHISKGTIPHVRNASIDRPENAGWHEVFADEEKRDEEIKRVIKLLLGKDAKQLQEEAKRAEVEFEEIV
jgi:uncharacterized sporulation protein YeaH/YhbH (DUF444 family)